MEFQFSDREQVILKTVGKAADACGFETYVIGGFVRDKLLSRPTANIDIDIVCVGDGITLAHKVATLFYPNPHVAIFKNFGTAQLTLHDGIKLEFVGARKESYSRDSRNPKVIPGTLHQDQMRRDFTINALAIGLSKEVSGTLLDPFDGVKDLENKIIRTPLDPSATFSDDPLRMLRAVRFACQLGFYIHEDTYAALQANASRLSIISQERITDELNKIIVSHNGPYGLEILSNTGLLNYFFPEMEALHGAEYIDGIGHKDNFYHTLKVLENVSNDSDDLYLRWAAILHDIGKPATKKFEPGHGWTFHGHEVVGSKMVPRIFKRFRLPLNEKMRFVQKLVFLHLRPISLTKENITDSAVRRLLFEAGDDVESLMILCRADITSKNKRKVSTYLSNYEHVMERMKAVEAADHLRNWQPPVSGEIIMDTFGLSPSREVGILKDAIREAILDGLIDNNYDAAFQFMLNKAKEIGLSPIKEI